MSRLNPEARTSLLRFFHQPNHKIHDFALPIHFLRFILMNRSSLSSARRLLYRCWLRVRGANDFEITLDSGRGPSIKLSEEAFFVVLQLVQPERFRLCYRYNQIDPDATRIDRIFFTIKQQLDRWLSNSEKQTQTQRLIDLSSGATALVMGCTVENFIPLIENIAPRLDYMECDLRVLKRAKLTKPLELNVYVPQSTKKRVCLDDVFQHEIKYLDLRSRFCTDYYVSESCKTQLSLQTVVLRGDIDNLRQLTDKFVEFQRYAPNLSRLHVRLVTDIELSSKCREISREIGRLFDRLHSFADPSYRPTGIQHLTIEFNAYLSVTKDSHYETTWARTLRDHSFFVGNPEIVFHDLSAVGASESFAVCWRTESVNLEFRAELRQAPMYGRPTAYAN
ncbi:hypothetical protein M3Y96_00394400 [Aphelenchoides besseyi]|nr:hypothetical protein M3Y96_00394400 [Aphelenchoides besseyi]